MKTVTVFLNNKNDDAIFLAKGIINYLTAQGDVDLVLPEGKIGFSPEDFVDVEFAQAHSFLGVDFAVVLGGDGTILGTARALSAYDVPILGVNLGRVGFLTEVEKANVFVAIDAVFNGRCYLDKRMLLSATVLRDGEPVYSGIALNDMVVSATFSRTITLDLFIDDQDTNTYRTDGLILSTPTGSTAYSMSAGGPIVSPELEVFVITPICQHNSFSCPFVINTDSKIELVCQSFDNRAVLTADGQNYFLLQQGDHIMMKKAETSISFIRLGDKKFFATLKERLKK